MDTKLLFQWREGCIFCQHIDKTYMCKASLGEARQNCFILVQYKEYLTTSMKLDEDHQNSGDIYNMFHEDFCFSQGLYHVKLYHAEKTEPHNYELTTKLGHVHASVKQLLKSIQQGYNSSICFPRGSHGPLSHGREVSG